MVLQKAETINSLTPTFKKYEEVTEAKLNFNKCFVFSTKFFKLIDPYVDNYDLRGFYCAGVEKQKIRKQELAMGKSAKEEALR